MTKKQRETLRTFTAYRCSSLEPDGFVYVTWLDGDVTLIDPDGIHGPAYHFESEYILDL